MTNPSSTNYKSSASQSARALAEILTSKPAPKPVPKPQAQAINTLSRNTVGTSTPNVTRSLRALPNPPATPARNSLDPPSTIPAAVAKQILIKPIANSPSQTDEKMNIKKDIDSWTIQNSFSKEQEKIIDTAVTKDQDDILHYLIGVAGKKLDKTEVTPGVDNEGVYYERLIEARKRGVLEEQVINLTKIGILYTSKNNLIIAAKILNGALVLLKNIQTLRVEHFTQYLHAKLLQIEEKFYHSKKLKLPQDRLENLKCYKAFIKNYRNGCNEQVQKKFPIQNVQAELTDNFISLLRKIIQRSQDIVGKPPCKWACIGMGSMARGEMCPYSDVEFAFLLDTSSETNLNYFRTLSQIIELQIINLGETKYPLFERADPDHPSATPSGFSLDTGGNTPLGVSGVYELIGTPEQLAQFQTPKWMERNIILPNAMNTVCLVAGDLHLVEDYTNHKDKISEQKEKGKPSNRENLAWQLLEGHLEEFKPNLTKDKEQMRAFGIKRELYRPFQEVMSCLAIFLKLREKSTFKRIDELVGLKIFSSAGADNLKKVISLVLSLRVKAHLFYQDEEEKIFHKVEGNTTDPQLLYFDDKLVNDVETIYKTLIPFHEKGEEFFRTKNPKVFFTSNFFREAGLNQAKSFVKGIKFVQARGAFQQAVALNPNNFEAVRDFAALEEDFDNDEEAFKRSQSALQLAIQKYGTSHASVAVVYCQLGLLHMKKEELQKSREYYQKALEIFRKDPNANRVYLGAALCNLGQLFVKENNDSAAENLLIEALNVYSDQGPEEKFRVLYSDENAGAVLGNLASLNVRKGQFKAALDYLEEALKMKLATVGESHPDTAITYSSISSVYFKMKNYKKALETISKAIKINVSAYTEFHRIVAENYSDMGGIYDSDKQPKKALECHQKALEIYVRLKADSEDFAKCYNNIASAHNDLNEDDKALEFYQKALDEYKKGALPTDGLLAGIHNNMAYTYNKKKLFLKAVYKYKDAFILLTELRNKELGLTILNNLLAGGRNLPREQMLIVIKEIIPSCVKLLGENHNITQQLLSLFAEEDSSGEEEEEIPAQYQAEIERAKRSLEITLANFGDKHPAALVACHKIGTIYLQFGRTDEAIKYLNDALKYAINIHGESDESVAACYSALGGVYGRMRKDMQAMEMFKKQALVCKAIGALQDMAEGIQNMIIAAQGNEGPQVNKAVNEVLPVCIQAFGQNHPLIKNLKSLLK
ncbi:MAG: tetratricopeptide repeat protein [Parachlamydia sp.]|nr:tetratricopeptide repeat protein [Parachlamydia sp.]